MTWLSPRRRERWRRAYGPAAVVTGASDGIGRAMAGALAEIGMDVVLVARREAVLAELARDLAARHGIAARPVAADLARPDGPAAVFEATRETDVGLLVAAAGFGAAGRFVEADRDDALAMVDVNCRALLDLAHGYARRFVGRGRGGLVLMSSLVAFQGVPNAANYAATKAYVQVLAEGLRGELAPAGVDVLAVAPGPVHSGFADRAGMRLGLAARPDAVARGALRTLGRRTTARPGALSKGLEASLALLPRTGRVRMMGRVMAGMVAPADDRSRPASGASA